MRIEDAPIRIIASDASWIDPVAVEQLRQTAALEGIDAIVGLPDLHAGRGIAVGAAFWSRSHVHPHLVGSDIGCGMALWETETPLRKFRLDAADRKLRGLEEPWEGDHAACLAKAGLPASLMGDALGSIGGGNHFAEMLCIDSVCDDEAFASLGLDTARVHLMIHSGSRGLGAAILDEQLARRNVSPLKAGDDACAAYLARHDEAIGWAVLNREIIARRFFERLGMKGRRLLDICHNSVTADRGGWLHRKGAAPADHGPIVIPGSRGDLTYLVRPRPEHAEEALQSLAHGAGRKWSRSEARDKLRRRFTVAELERTRLGSRVICEDRELIYEEAPQAYKDIRQVVADLDRAGLITIVAALRPLITYKTRRA
ncbi:RNA ligase RtcB family protein [Sphingomonas oligophenolica]|uniref:3'-phosphate/5'-hydroxy nucleic acid ligase n=1 Tax=Sphingomonas oligophenolica TaxID=301154 RepID=A0ABU9Y130_9SPHN